MGNSVVDKVSDLRLDRVVPGGEVEQQLQLRISFHLFGINIPKIQTIQKAKKSYNKLILPCFINGPCAAS